jgi:hypothetical protein
MNTGTVSKSLLEESKLTQYPYEEGDRVSWEESRILGMEDKSRYKKYK